MKRRILLLFTILFSLFTSLSAQNIGEAFYIYRNDGDFNAFFREEIDSIAYSYYDLDSIWHSDIVTQVIYTQDSTYTIPLEAIDSVSFVQPKEEYQNGVLRMNTDWLSYVISVTDDAITFSSSTPTYMLPTVGQIIVAETFEHPFERGFAGRVTNITTTGEGIVCTAEGVGLSDIYKHLVCTGFTSSVDENEVKGNGSPRRIWAQDLHPGQFPLPRLDVSVGPVNVSCDADVRLKYTICIGERNLKDYVDIRCFQTYDGSVSISTKFETPYTPEPNWKFTRDFATSVPGLYGRISLGGFLRATGTVSISATQPFVINGTTGLVCGTGRQFQGINEWHAKMKDTEIALNIDGTLSLGVAVRLQFGILHERVASVDLTAYVGPQLSGHLGLTSAGLIDKRLYSAIKDSEVKLAFGAEVIPGYRWFGESQHQELPVSLNLGYDINHWYVVPEFSDLAWEKDASGKSGTLSGTLSRNLLPKVSLGWGLYDNDDNLYDSYYFSQSYRKLEDWNNDGLSYHLNDLPSGSRYTAYPIVNVMGCEMRGNEGVEITAAPTVETLQAMDVKGSSAICSGYVDGLEYGTVVDAGICYSTDRDAEQWDNVSAHQREDGEFSVKLTGLHGNTTYYYCAYAYVDGEYYFSDDVKSFTTSFPAAITDFRVTNSQYKKDGFSNDGQTYDYKFNASVTAEIESLDNVADWGYVYRDPNGREKEISLMSHGTSYIDTNYAYYRDEPQSTACLYPYVKYADDGQTIHGEAVNYPLSHNGGVTTCPDANHPHMIDLGIGTLWACCNVGASAPEQYGNYYAWGETQPKSVYNDVTYNYFTGQDTNGDGWIDQNFSVVNIGSDISGTQYDAARANWGAPWRMPTLAECQALHNQCTSEWTTVNGVYGRKFTGPNGGSIFLPAAGFRWGGELYDAGSDGYYWLSTFYESYPYSAFYLYFYSVDAGWGSNSRHGGHTVRPVR